jgi:hypothetical protein
MGVSRDYHRALAAVLDRIYPSLDPIGVVQGVGVNDHDFMVRLLAGKTRSALAINAEDITSGMAMLVALYLSSPIVRYWRRILVFFPVAVFALFVLHALTVVTFSQEAFVGNPAIARLAHYSQRQANLLVWYNVFYEQLGMYLYVLALWLPYILITLNNPRNSNNRNGRVGSS